MGFTAGCPGKGLDSKGQLWRRYSCCLLNVRYQARQSFSVKQPEGRGGLRGVGVRGKEEEGRERWCERERRGS